MASHTAIAVLVFVVGFVVNVDALNRTCAPTTGDSMGDLMDHVMMIENTLGYADLDSLLSRQATDAVEHACTLRIAKMINENEKIVAPTARSAQAAVYAKSQKVLESSCPGFGLCADVSDGGDPDVWPISTMTYMLVPTNATDWEEGCDKVKTLYDYAKWILESEAAAELAGETSMATMPPIVAENAVKILDQMQCHDSVHGLQRVKDRLTRSNTLDGAGSFLQANLQARLTNEFFQQNFVSISYTSSGSANGMAALRAREQDFAGTDDILDMQDPEFIRRGMKMIPVFAAAIGVVFNLDQVDELLFSRSVLNRLFTGEAFSWRDPELLADNPDVAHLLPDQAVIRVVLASESTATATLTKALHSFAGHPTPARDLDYSAHVLGGSSLPEWPAHPQPYPGETVCRVKECIDLICDPGYFQHKDDKAVTCLQCPLGTFSAVQGQHTACDPCPAGSYTNTEGNSQCVQCDDQKYQDQAGQQACKPCPLNSHRFSTEVLRDGVLVREQAPGVAAGECKCVAGYWLPASVGDPGLGGQDCVQCPDGAECRGYPEHIPQPKRGFWGRQDHPHEMFECAVDACVGSFECKAGHQGRKCAGPVEGYFTIGELWFFECPAPGFRAVFTLFGVLCVVAVWVLTHHLSLKYDAFAIAFLFFQIIGIISKFRLRWHPNLNIVLIALRIINFDVDFFGPQCLFPGWDTASAFYTQLFLPLIVVVLYALYFAARKRYRQHFGTCGKAESLQGVENKGYLRSPAYSSDDLGIYLSGKGTTYLLMMFHTLAARAFAVFVCETDADGAQHYMVTAPTLQCWTTKHIVMVAAAVVYILTVICGVPLLLLWRMLQAKRDDKLCDLTVTVSYWFLFVKFRATFPYWELVLLLRRFVLVLILVFVPYYSMLQALLALACLNAFLFLHLTYNPFKDTRVGLLDSFGLCCSMAYAVCGMLFFPSLDDALECVGSANLADLGEQCGANRALKEEASTVLLLLLLFTLLAALYISFRDIQEKVYSAAAAKKIEADKQWYGKDKLFKAVRALPTDKRRSSRIASICRALQDESKGHLQALRSEASALLESVRDVTESSPARARKTVEMLRGMRTARSQRKLDHDHDFADPAKLNLCDMLVGDCLHSWQQSLSTLSDKELAVRLLFAEEGEGESMRQELAYMDLELWVPAFAVRQERVSGYFSSHQLGQLLRELVDGLPELINFLAVAQPAAVQSLSNFVHAFAIFNNTPPTAPAFHPLVVPVYRGQVVHWLMRCSEDEQRHFLALFRALSHPRPDTAPAPGLFPRLTRSWSRSSNNQVQPHADNSNAPSPEVQTQEEPEGEALA